MVSNSQRCARERLDSLEAAIKRVYASAFLQKARPYQQAGRHATLRERLAVIVQDVAGRRRNGRFYPEISGVACACNFYPVGPSRPSDGVVELTLGLRPSNLEPGPRWRYSPAWPQANPPYASLVRLVAETQKDFWAIDLAGTGDRSAWSQSDPLTRYSLKEAEQDGALSLVASTYDANDERVVMGLARQGPRLVDFAPLLKANTLPLNALLKELLHGCTEWLGTMAEVEFCVTLPGSEAGRAVFAVLRVGAKLARSAVVDLTQADLQGPSVLAASESALGNGTIASIVDVVYVSPATCDARTTHAIARQIEALNQRLLKAGRRYLLVGPGRWGSTDPGVGIPVRFAQISGASAIVEATLPTFGVFGSFGVHLFRDITEHQLLYFSVGSTPRERVDWAWLAAQPVVSEPGLVRHVQLSAPLTVRVDGRSGRGIVRR
jgi:hypothetical protein